jgi:uncharacterized membrane protein
MMLLLQAAESASREWRLVDVPETWILVLIIVPLIAGVAFLGYRSEPISTMWKATLGCLRCAAIALLVLVLFRPVIVEREEQILPAEVLVLLDDSASMKRVDSYADEATRRGLAPFAPSGLARASRAELVRNAVANRLLPALEAKGYKPRLMRFDTSATAMANAKALSARGHATHIGDALSSALSAHRGRHVTDVVLLSDGRSTGGSPPIDAARSAAAAGIPVHTLLVGDPRPEKNLRIELVEAPPSVLEGDEFSVSVRVEGRGLAPGTLTQVLLEELQPSGEARLLAEDLIEATEEGARVVLIVPPSGAGNTRERRLRVSLPPVTDETLLDDNALDISVAVTPERIRVLYVDGYPRWEYRYLKNLLLRADSHLEARCYLLSATPDFVQESSRDLTPLTRVPTSRQELLEDYDVIILGDVNPYAISPDAARCEEFQESLREFVEGGGGLLFQAGEYDNPYSFEGTALEELLPVTLDATTRAGFDGDTSREQRPSLEDPAAPHQIVRLHQDVETNRRLWETEAGLRGFYWYQPVARAKPGARVLLRHPTDEGPHGRYPLLSVGYYPSGRTLFMALDSTWMWRYRFGDRYHERFWRNAIRWLALGRLKSGNRRVRLDSLKSRWSLEERISVEARVLDEDFRPSEADAHEAWLEDPSGSRSRLRLERVESRAGLYRSGFNVERPGRWRVILEREGESPAITEFEVSLPSLETANPSPDPEALLAIAHLTAGEAHHLAQLEALLSAFPGGEERREPISTRLDDAWDEWHTLLLALALLSAEWILRKRVELV